MIATAFTVPTVFDVDELKSRFEVASTDVPFDFLVTRLKQMGPSIHLDTGSFEHEAESSRLSPTPAGLLPAGETAGIKKRMLASPRTT